MDAKLKITPFAGFCKAFIRGSHAACIVSGWGSILRDNPAATAGW
jgi:hypothetical protein